MDWVSVKRSKPLDGMLVNTKISDERGDRNEQKLVYKNNLWWLPDMTMYVYYTPTHWKNF